jgi:RNA chaperone Hfq
VNTKATEGFLERITKREEKNISVFLVNGIKLNGNYIDHDDISLIMSTQDNDEQLISRNAISTVVPGKANRR